MGGTAPLHQTTVGGRIAGKLPRAADYSLEATLQGGSVGVDAVRASAVHALLGKTFGCTPRVFAEYNYLGFGNTQVSLIPPAGAGIPINFNHNVQTTLIGLNYRFGGPFSPNY